MTGTAFHDPIELTEAMLQAWKTATKSRDPSTQLGAVLFREDSSDGEGMGDYIVRQFNHLPSGVPESVLKNRDKKYEYIIHAEVAVLNLAKAMNYPVDRQTTLVCPWACCMQCAERIVEDGVGIVVVDEGAMDRTPSRWKPSIEMGHRYLREHNVDILCIPTPKNKPETLFDGRLW